ncbi:MULTISPECIES: PfkB family carbohydrate kinase [unclassified Nocardia]|uniref:PfkB family carbohydrate kinase n=1 Tax=unclassified Nocardia TaxID=2637762 RepID=UPI0024A873CF|nr:MULTISPECIES: PfkB family carbohydrate kinase [unclassified Nocardia]
MVRQHSPRKAAPAPVPQDPGVIAVRDILLRLRKRSGLSLDRLHSTEIEIDLLLELPVVRRLARRLGLEPHEALVYALTGLARKLPASERLIVDVELNLKLLQKNPPPGCDPRRLYAEELRFRREYLAACWQSLHHALGVSKVSDSPSDRALRGVRERRAFDALAGLLTGASALVMTEIIPAEQESRLNSGVVTIVGDAVVDHTYAVNEIPGPGASAWGDLKRRPGGKGLNRAVASAQLGLFTHLVCAVGDDEDGDDVLAYLQKCEVDTGLVSIVAGARTPVTAVLVPEQGDSATIAYKDERLNFLAREHDHAAVRSALMASDVVILTFEQSAQMVEWVLDSVRTRAASPWVIVSASPPLRGPAHLREDLRGVHYAVGTPAELAALVADRPTDVDVSSTLLDKGVGAVCTIEGYRCTVNSPTGRFIVDRFESAGTCESYAPFVVALAYRLTTARRPAGDDDFVWATAALVAARGGSVRNRSAGTDAISADRIDAVVENW